MGYMTNSARNTNIYKIEEKAAIAEKAVSMLRDGAVIFIDGGTTCMELARIIPENLNLTCFTISLPVAMVLSHKANINVISIGGQISKEAQISIGANAIHHLSEVRFDYSFIGTGYVDAIYGLTEFDWDIVQIIWIIRKLLKPHLIMRIWS